MPLAAADEIPKQVPLKPWLEFRGAQHGRPSVPFLAHLLPSRRWLPSPLCCHFPGRIGGSCRLNCFLLEHLRTCHKRSDLKLVLCSAVLIQIKSKYLFCGPWLKYIYFTVSPKGPVIRCLRQGYRGADESELPSSLHWSLGSASRLVSTNAVPLLAEGTWDALGTLSASFAFKLYKPVGFPHILHRFCHTIRENNPWGISAEHHWFLLPRLVTLISSVSAFVLYFATSSLNNNIFSL